MDPTSPPTTVTPEQARRLIEHFGRIGIAFLPRSNVLPQLAPPPAGEPGRATAQAQSAAADSLVARTGPTPSPIVAGSATASRPRPPATAGPPTPAPASKTSVTPANPTAPGVVDVPLADRSFASPFAGDSLPAAERVDRLAELAAEVAACQRCDVLARCRKHTVFGEGNPQARICFFGEAPGQEEDLSGRPFVGPAGQLLTRMIEACTLSRDQVYILNTVKCRPPGNRNPEETERENCRPFFEEQLRIIRPDYIVCLGLVAAQTLLSTPLSIGRLRGKFYRYHDSKVLVTYHPSYLLRTPGAKREAWADLKMLMNDLGIDLNQR